MVYYIQYLVIERANNMLYIYKPDYAIHPAEYLEEVLEARGIKTEDISNQLGISTAYLNRIINERLFITTDMAAQLEKVLNIPDSIWINLSANYARFEVEQKSLKEKNEK